MLFYLVQPEVCSVMLRGTVRYVVLCYRVQQEVCTVMLWSSA